MDNFCVYVIKLKKSVLGSRKFRNKNGSYLENKPCVYVGSTSTTPEDRLKVHMGGGMFSSSWVRRFGKKLFPWAYEGLPIFGSEDEAKEAESRYADELRSRGWGVWQA